MHTQSSGRKRWMPMNNQNKGEHRMAMSKQDREEQKELKQQVSDNMSQLLQLKTVLVGVNGDNGINGRQKDMERDISDLREAYHSIKEDFGVIRNDVAEMKKSAKFWTRTIGSALIIQIIVILFSLIK